jgi:hypothetical protein
MKRKIGLALATGLALLVAGCSGQNAGGSTSGGGEQFPAGPGHTASEYTRSSVGASSTARNFNLAVKCPGVHWEKKHGWSNQQIMQQESLDESDIPACEEWVAAQPKGYVPPPPSGTPMAAQAPSGGAPAPAKQ